MQVQFDAGLIRKYGITGPRYTSYPTAVNFHEGFDAEAYRRHTQQSNDELIPRPLSLYVHLPFCQSLCYYCGCNKKITRHARHGVTYLNALDREIELQGTLFDRDRTVIQLHFGGGTPTFFDDSQLGSILAQLGRHFPLMDAPEREYAIEIDPRTVDANRLGRLAGLGFNRLSLGVQDFDPGVQQAVNRVQDTGHTLALVSAARTAGFESLSLDLIYGLPLQTLDSFARTLDAVIGARPDRLSVYNYAHMPQLFRAQRLICEEDLPTPETRLALLQLTIDRLTDAGYEYIGMDHFALPDDELARARDSGRLQRNFQGYSTCPDADLVGLGVSAIGKVGSCYVQNFKDIRHWQAAVEAGQLPTWRGISLSHEDRVRRAVVESVMCRGEVRVSEIEQEFDIDFAEFFAPEMERMMGLERDGLVQMGMDGLDVTPIGMLLLRAVAMVFDEYLQPSGRPAGFSRVI